MFSTKKFLNRQKRQNLSKTLDIVSAQSNQVASPSIAVKIPKKRRKRMIKKNSSWNIQNLTKVNAPEEAVSTELKNSTSAKEVLKKRKRPRDSKNLIDSVDVNNSVRFNAREESTKLKSSSKTLAAPLKTAGFCWNADAKVLAEVIDPNHASESSDDDDENVSKKKKKRITLTEKKEAAKKEEERLRAVEESLASNTNVPSSCDEFDRAVLSKPDSSELWLQYMAFHLQATEIEKARAVAQRALKTISYRKEQEKFNIWVGLLNLENLYGTPESLKTTLYDALQFNDAYKVRVQMINIFSEHRKLRELECELRLINKKFRNVKGVWLEIGTILYKYGHIRQGRRLLQQGLESLRNKNDRVALISRFGILEAKFGEIERGMALFDSILMANPQRVDVWSVYVDQLCKAGMIKQARNTLDRAISHKLKARWMKILFAKYLTFEEKYGTSEGTERVREKAREYVEKVSGEKLED